jgi:hypothetical protein
MKNGEKRLFYVYIVQFLNLKSIVSIPLRILNSHGSVKITVERNKFYNVITFYFYNNCFSH